jgi:hypothetical protein
MRVFLLRQHCVISQEYAANLVLLVRILNDSDSKESEADQDDLLRFVIHLFEWFLSLIHSCRSNWLRFSFYSRLESKIMNDVVLAGIKEITKVPHALLSSLKRIIADQPFGPGVYVCTNCE